MTVDEPTGPGRSVVLAGGGTAGHTSPLIATAQELRRLRPDLTLTVIGTARGLETTVVPAAGLTLDLIPPVPMPRRPGRDLALVGPRLVQALFNLAVVLRMLPVAGVPLPLLSYGGSALMANLMAVGVLLACARREPAARRVLAKKSSKPKPRMTTVIGSRSSRSSR